MDSRERVLYQLLTAFAVLRLLVLPVRSSFWLDETGTYWVIKDGLANLFARTRDWSGQSPLYYLVAWLAHFAPGRTEVVLRLPSLIAMIAAAWLLYKLAARLLDAETAPFAVLIFSVFRARGHSRFCEFNKRLRESTLTSYRDTFHAFEEFAKRRLYRTSINSA